MLEDTCKVVCNECEGFHYDDTSFRPDYFCYLCDSEEVTIIPYSEMSQEDIFRVIDNELESANAHSAVGVPEKLYESIKEYIYPDCYAKVARKISDIFCGMV